MEKLLRYYSDLYERSCVITAMKSGRELLCCRDNPYADVVFLDIDMPGFDGFDVAAKLRESNINALIVFVTNHDDWVYQIWEYKPFWFIRKSHLEELKNLFPALLEKLDAYEQNEHQICYLQADNQILKLDMRLLVSVESSRHNLLLTDVSGQTTVCRCKIAEAEKQLLPFYILRIQKGIMINCRFISKVTSREVILSNGMRFGIGRDRIMEVKNQFHQYLRSL